MNSMTQWPFAKYWGECWNPIVGCRPCSPACDNCYAREMMVNRFKRSFDPHESTKKKPPEGGVVFCGNMTDLFGEWVLPGTALQYILSAAYSLEDTTYLWLTKRPSRMVGVLHFLPPGCLELGCMSSHFFGFTAENQACYDMRIRDWRADAPAWATGWLSAEPLLGRIDLGLRYVAPEDQPFKWVVVGCESGPRRRPCKIEWVEWIVEECLAAGVPVFVKQLDLNGRCETNIDKFPKLLRIRQVPW